MQVSLQEIRQKMKMNGQLYYRGKAPGGKEAGRGEPRTEKLLDTLIFKYRSCLLWGRQDFAGAANWRDKQGMLTLWITLCLEMEPPKTANMTS